MFQFLMFQSFNVMMYQRYNVKQNEGLSVCRYNYWVCMPLTRKYRKEVLGGNMQQNNCFRGNLKKKTVYLLTLSL